VGVKLDEDGARSPGSSLVPNTTHALLLALLGWTKIRRASKLVGCGGHEHTLPCQSFCSNIRRRYSSHISSALRPRPDERAVLPPHSLRAQELLIGGRDIKGTTKERGSAHLALPRFLDAGTSHPFELFLTCRTRAKRRRH
jgi:hypothetical protein